MAVTRAPRPSTTESRDRGMAARERTPLSAHGGWAPGPDRADPVSLLEEQNTTRVPDLVPVRHGRMMVSPFTFYRGAAKIMAADLATGPTAGLTAQLCGDAHLSNFGAFASPERQLLFDLNDFDETLPGPIEYDVKRMAASFTIAARNNGFSAEQARTITLTSVRAYRTAMAEFAGMGTMELWYAHVSEADLRRALDRAATTMTSAATKNATKAGAKGAAKAGAKGATKGSAKAKKKGKGGYPDQVARRAEKQLAKAHTRDSLQALSKLGEVVDGRYRIVSQPPLVVPARDLAERFGLSQEEVEHTIRDEFRQYRSTLQHDRRDLLERFEVVDVAHKVVGVGSVGTRAFIVLLQGRDQHDPLFLQIKEASRSVLEDHLPRSRFRNPGERVVHGQRMMQAASDIYLGWSKGRDLGRHFYWRQLRDMKASAVVETMLPTGMEYYAALCGWTLARAHARSGDPVALAAYLGADDRFEQAIADFAERYADQNEQDFQAFTAAVGAGRLTALQGL